MAKALAPVSYIKSVLDEGRKVVWPSRELVIRHTLLVVATVAIAVLIFAGIDYGLQKLVIAVVER